MGSQADRACWTIGVVCVGKVTPSQNQHCHKTNTRTLAGAAALFSRLSRRADKFVRQN